MRYLKLSQPSQQYAEGLSSALYRLSAKSPSDETKYAVAWFVDAVTGDVLLDLNGDQYLQPGADIGAFVALLPIGPAEAASLTVQLEAARGMRLRYVDMLPMSMRGQLVASFNESQEIP